MLDSMKFDALDLAKKAIKRFKSESDIADYIKTEFD